MSVLFLLRHGEAEPAGAHDDLRRLTDRGWQQVRRAAGLLPVEGLTLYHSPYVRTVESAQAIREHISVRSEQAARWLTPDTVPEEALAQLELLSGQSLLLVTHNPLVTRLAALLSAQPETAVTFGTGSVARLSGGRYLAGCLTFEWL